VFCFQAGTRTVCGVLFFSRRYPRIYGLQKIATDLGLKLFEQICAELGVESCPDPRQVIADVSLIQMVANDFYYELSSERLRAESGGRLFCTSLK